GVGGASGGRIRVRRDGSEAGGLAGGVDLIDDPRREVRRQVAEGRFLPRFRNLRGGRCVRRRGRRRVRRVFRRTGVRASFWLRIIRFDGGRRRLRDLRVL